MRRFLLFSLMLLLVAPSLVAGGFKKAYFGATAPGSWARYSDTSPGMNMTTTMTRLADDGGSARIELLVEFANGQYPSMRNRYTLRQGFPLDRQLLDYMTEITAGSVVSGDSAPTVLDAATVASIIKSSHKYEPTVTFKGTENVGGNAADRYSYKVALPGSPATTESGDFWLSDAVPFGVVKQTSTTKDTKGHVTTSYERMLVASGTKAAGASSAGKMAKAAPPKATTKTLKEAYDAGLVQVMVTVPADAHNGERAHVVLEKKDDERLPIVVPKGKTTLHVDMPLEDFVFEIPAERTFELGGGKTAQLDVNQLGEQRAMGGTFTISTYEGTPLFSGNATVGWVKKK